MAPVGLFASQSRFNSALDSRPRFRCSGSLLRSERVRTAMAQGPTNRRPGIAFHSDWESERRFYHLFAWVVMPNHVHLLIRPQVAVPILTRWLKDPLPEGPTFFWVGPDNRSGRTNRTTNTSAVRARWAGPSPTSRTTLSPQAWSTARTVGIGLARDGRRHGLPPEPVSLP